jgi:hypothetical protein
MVCSLIPNQHEKFLIVQSNVKNRLSIIDIHEDSVTL